VSLVAGGSCDTKFRSHLFAISIDGGATIEARAAFADFRALRNRDSSRIGDEV